MKREHSLEGRWGQPVSYGMVDDVKPMVTPGTVAP